MLVWLMKREIFQTIYIVQREDLGMELGRDPYMLQEFMQVGGSQTQDAGRLTNSCMLSFMLRPKMVLVEL